MPALFHPPKLGKMPNRTNTLAFDLIEMDQKYGNCPNIVQTKMEMAEFLNVLINS
jgi:hypothetical protein